MHRTVRYTATLKQTHCTVQENMGIKKPNNLVQAVSSNQYACIADTDSAVLWTPIRQWTTITRQGGRQSIQLPKDYTFKRTENESGPPSTAFTHQA